MTTDQLPSSGEQPKTDVVPALPTVVVGVEHKPTRRMRRLVEGMVASGVTQKSIAQMLEMSEDCLQKHYRRELDMGAERAVALLSRSLYRRAMQGDTTAAIFWLKARGRWRDRDAMSPVVVMPQGDGEPPKLEQKQVEDAIFAALAKLRPVAEVAKPKALTHQ